MGGSGEKSPNKDLEKRNVSNFQNLSQSVFVTENPTYWGLETAVGPIFAKPVLDIFAVYSLLSRINFSHMQQSYLCLKNQNYLLGKADLRFFPSYGLRTTIIFSTFYVTDNFSSRYSQNLCKTCVLFSK